MPFKHLYDIGQAKQIIKDLKSHGVTATIIGSLPSDHDIDILIDRKTLPSVVVFLHQFFDPITWKITDIDSRFYVSRKYGHVDVFFRDPEESFRQERLP